VELQGHHPILVPPMGQELPMGEGRPGVRLLCRPLEGCPDVSNIDVTSTAAIAMLEGFLATGRQIGKRLAWRSRGHGVLRRDTLHIRPVWMPETEGSERP
jgi:hypothetical protein